jgi:pimeloyl-ACP methyl ester carboxylesterase
MATAFAASPDGVRIAYETFGAGPPVILLHGGGQTKAAWIEPGYPQRLADRFQVIAMDVRGNGESDGPRDPAAYGPERMCADVLAVADACGAERFALVGYSMGGNIGRYLAKASPRISRFVMIGVGFGPGASGAFRDRLDAMLAPFAAVLAAPDDPSAVDALPAAQQAQWRDPRMGPLVALFAALKDYPPLEPEDLPCPTLWLVGGGNEVGALAEVERLRDRLPVTNVELQVVGRLDHAGELTAIDEMLPPIAAFLSSALPRESGDPN